MRKANRRRPGRGALSLGSVLAVAAIMLVAAFSMAALTWSHLNLARRYANVQDARYLAEACIAETVGQIEASRGHEFPGSQGLFTHTPPGDPGRFGVLSFSATTFRNVAVPASSGGIPSGRKGGSVLLRAVGYSRGALQPVEALVEIPQFPYAILANGDVMARAPLEVGPLISSGQPAGPRQAHLGSQGNVVVPQPGNIVIHGDVVAGGRIQGPLGPEQVDGRMVQGAGALDIPHLDLARYEPLTGAFSVGPNDVFKIPGPRIAAQDIPKARGFYVTDRSVHGGDLTIDGVLELDNDLLYVYGDLAIHGGLRGRGLVVVQGSTILDGGVDLGGVPDDSQDRVVALLSRGDVRLTGSEGVQSARRFFEGLVYTEGSFTATHVRIAGALVMAPPAGGSGGGPGGPQAMSLEDVRLEYTLKATDLVITASTPGVDVSDLVEWGWSAGIYEEYQGNDPSIRARWKDIHDDLVEALKRGLARAGASPAIQPGMGYNQPGTTHDDVRSMSVMQIDLGTDWARRLEPFRAQLPPKVQALLDRKDDYRGAPLVLVVHVERPDPQGRPVGSIPNPDLHVARSADGRSVVDLTGKAPGSRAEPHVSYGSITFADWALADQQHVPRFPNGSREIGIKEPGEPADAFNLIARQFGGPPDSYGTMEQASLQCQSAVADRVNRMVDAIPGATAPGASVSRTIPLDLSQFLTHSYPLRITGWREP